MSQEEVIPESNRTSEDLDGPRPGMRRGLIIIAASVLLVAILIGSWFLLKSGGNTKGTPSTSDKTTQMPTVPVSRVVSKDVDRQLKLPGELRAYQDVAIYPRCRGLSRHSTSIAVP